jgi:hypothetical protein
VLPRELHRSVSVPTRIPQFTESRTVPLLIGERGADRAGAGDD